MARAWFFFIMAVPGLCLSGASLYFALMVSPWWLLGMLAAVCIMPSYTEGKRP